MEEKEKAQKLYGTGIRILDILWGICVVTPLSDLEIKGAYLGCYFEIIHRIESQKQVF